MQEIVFQHPKSHYEIVTALANGSFVLFGEPLYDEITENFDYYNAFFGESFKVELVKQSEIYYVKSSDAKEELSRKIMLVLSVYIYEINLDGKNIYDTLMTQHLVKEFVDVINNSSYSKMCKQINIENMLQACRRKNIVKFFDEERFVFTKAIEIFLEHAKNIAEIDLKE